MLRAIRHIQFGFSEICIFVKEMTTFIQQGHIKVIKSDSKGIFNDTED